MKGSPITRREAARRLFLVSATLMAPAWLTACGKKELVCTDTYGLAPDEAATRTTQEYADKSPDPEKACAKCNLYRPVMEGQCGSCTTVKGPINPGGHCKSFVVKVT